jgi:uncharacterized protein YndB with AHSA1/START domain
MKVIAEPGSPQVILEREFDAPRELVYRAHVDPELLVQWLGPRRLKMRIEQYDVRDGGRYRYVHSGEDGTEHGFHGVFHGDPSPGGIVQTFEYEGYPGHVSMDTAVFEDRGDKTLVRINSVFQSVEDRDGMYAAGAEEGMTEGYERLDELLVRMTAPVA